MVPFWGQAAPAAFACSRYLRRMTERGDTVAIDPATSYLKRVARVALVTKLIVGVALLAGILVTGGYYLQYQHAATTLGPAQAAALSAQKQYSAASAAELTATGNDASAKADYQAQLKLELLTGTVGSQSTSMMTDMVNTQNLLAQADTALSDATAKRDGTVMALHLTQAYVREASSQLLLAAIASGIVLIIAALVAFFASMSASKARAMIALTVRSGHPATI